MKKLIFAMVLLIGIICLCSVALAEGEIPTEPFSWDYLATIAGATVATVLIVQLLKLPLDKVWKIPTRIVVYFIALIITLLATYFTVGLTLENALLSALNAVIIALAAMGSYELTFAGYDEKKAEDEGENG